MTNKDKNKIKGKNGTYIMAFFSLNQYYITIDI